MAPLLSQTLIRAIASPACRLYGPKARAARFFSVPPERSSLTDLMAESDAKAVERIEDVIRSYVIKKSKPDWLPFVPGASYWVPPGRTSPGVAEYVRTLANALSDEEALSLTILQGCPSSAFYIYNV